MYSLLYIIFTQGHFLPMLLRQKTLVCCKTNWQVPKTIMKKRSQMKVRQGTERSRCCWMSCVTTSVRVLWARQPTTACEDRLGQWLMFGVGSILLNDIGKRKESSTFTPISRNAVYSLFSRSTNSAPVSVSSCFCDIRLCVETMLRRAMFWAKMGRSGTY
jgi:hypothetical protein